MAMLMGAVSVYAEADVDIYGFIKFDINYNTKQTNNGDAVAVVTGDDAQFSATLRHTRFGITTTEQTSDGTTIKGKIETDFFGAGGTENKPNLRLRHANISWRKGDTEYIIGQQWDIYAPMLPKGINASGYTYLDNGYRRPMLHVKKHLGENRSFSYAIARPISNEGVIEGNSSLVDSPDIQFAYDINNEMNINGFFGTRNDGAKDYDAFSIAFDMKKKIGKNTLAIELFSGQALAGYGGGLGYDIRAGEEVECSGGWINYIMNRDDNSTLSIAAGVQTNDDENLNIVTPDREKNTMLLFSLNRKINDKIVFAPEVEFLETEYADGSDFSDTRVAFTWMYVY
jgi:hypothetical protein